MDGALTHTCPQCGQSVAGPADPSANLLECPNCGNQFFIKRARPLQRVGTRDVAQRVHDLTRGRRQLIRFRSYLVVGALGCVIVLGQATYWLIRYSWEPAGRNMLAVLAVLSLIGGVFFARKAIAASKLLSRPLQQAPTKPPDFGAMRLI